MSIHRPKIAATRRRGARETVMHPLRLISPLLRIPAALGWQGCAWVALVIVVAAGVLRHFTSSRTPAYQRYASRLADEQRLLTDHLSARPDDAEARLRLVRNLRREYLLHLSRCLDEATGGQVMDAAEEESLRRRWLGDAGR